MTPTIATILGILTGLLLFTIWLIWFLLFKMSQMKKNRDLMIEDLREEIRYTNNEYRDTLIEKSELQEKIANFNEELGEWRRTYTSIEEIKEKLLKKVDELASVEKRYQEELNKQRELDDAIKAKMEERHGYELGIIEIQRAVKENESLRDSLLREKVRLENECALLSRTFVAASNEVRRLSGDADEKLAKGPFEFQLTPSERRLIELLAELKGLYADLSAEFSNIEWRKVWMSKVQEICKMEGLDKVGGIYRLKLKSKEEGCDDMIYIGQAVNIKDRWYQHIKKMIGVESKGNEIIYRYRPDQFEWGVVEVADEEVLEEIKKGGMELGEWLNKKERYWIEMEGRMNKK